MMSAFFPVHGGVEKHHFGGVVGTCSKWLLVHGVLGLTSSTVSSFQCATVYAEESYL